MLLPLSESDPSKSERFHLKGLDWSMQLGWDLVSSVHVCGVHNKINLSSWGINRPKGVGTHLASLKMKEMNFCFHPSMKNHIWQAFLHGGKVSLHIFRLISSHLEVQV